MRFWPWKKKKVEPNKTLFDIKYTPTKFNIGKTLVRYTFSDRRKFTVAIYGDFYQSVDRILGKAWPFQIEDSLHRAQAHLTNIVPGHSINLQDDIKNVRKVSIGQIQSAKILSTKSYEEEFNVASIVEKSVEKNESTN